MILCGEYFRAEIQFNKLGAQKDGATPNNPTMRLLDTLNLKAPLHMEMLKLYSTPGAWCAAPLKKRLQFLKLGWHGELTHFSIRGQRGEMAFTV